MSEFEDPSIMIGFSVSEAGWVGQARIRNDLGLSFGAASDFSGLRSMLAGGKDFGECLTRVVADLRTLHPAGGEPSAEGEVVLNWLWPPLHLVEDEF